MSGDFCSHQPAVFFCSAPAARASTWLAQDFPGALQLDLLAPEVLRAYLARPERLRERIAATPTTKPLLVVIDEVQKAPQLLDVVHALVEEQPQLRFALTGSSARKLRHGAANLWKLWWPSICGRSASCGDGVTPSASGALGPDWRWILWCTAPSWLQAFGADYPEAERWLLSFSPEPLGIDGIRCEPLELWLQQLQVEPPG